MNNKPVKRSKKQDWTEKQIADLVKLYPINDNETAAKKIGKSVRAIRSKAQYLKLKKETRYWILKDEKFVLKNWAVLSPEEIGEKLGKTKWAIINKYRELKGLRTGHKKLSI